MTVHQNVVADQISSCASTALEVDFPIVEISHVAEQESWRKEINRPIYHIHKWWAQRLGSVFRAVAIAALSKPDTDVWQSFYKQHNFAGKVVLDPFMGSGTTLGEALKLGASAIGCDINPVSSFLVGQALTNVSEQKLREALSELEASVAPRIRECYSTVDPQTGNPIPVMYYFWVKVVITPDGEEIPLFDRYVFAQNAYPKKKPKAQIICPHCWFINEDRYDVTELTCQSCGNNFTPQAGPAKGQNVTANNGKQYKIKDLLPEGAPPQHKMYAMLAVRENGDKIYLPITEEDNILYNKVSERLHASDLPIPSIHVRAGHNTDQARGYNYLKWNQFFNERQLYCLGILLNEICKIQDETVREQMICLFSSTLEFNNMFCSYKGEGTGAVRHMFSNHILKPERTPLENSVWGNGRGSGTFSSLFESRLLKAKQYLDTPFEVSTTKDLFGQPVSSSKITASRPIKAPIVKDYTDLITNSPSVMVLNGDSSRLPLADETVDAVITDPPYFDFVHYSELSDFFFAWFSPVLKSKYQYFKQEDSSNAGEVQQKDPRIFASQLANVLRESARVLKNDGVLAFSFHHSRPEGWAAIYEALQDAGLRVVAAHPIHAELRRASPKSAAKDPISLDAILVCRKITSICSGNYRSAPDAAAKLSHRLKSAGLNISRGDDFVIAASQMLIKYGDQEMSYDRIVEHLRTLT